MKSPLPPALGSVFGFDFIFPPKKYTQVHPGLIFGAKMLPDGRCQVLVLPISHKDPAIHEPRLLIPPLERSNMGLDYQQQYVYYSRLGKFILPEASRMIHRLGKAYIGQASDSFWKEAKSRFLEFRKTGM